MVSRPRSRASDGIAHHRVMRWIRLFGTARGWGPYDRLVLTVIAVGIVWLCVASVRRTTTDVQIVDIDAEAILKYRLFGGR